MKRPVRLAGAKGEAIARRGYRVSEVARMFGIPRSSVYREIERGRLTAVRFATESLLVMAEDLEAWIEAGRKPRKGRR